MGELDENKGQAGAPGPGEGGAPAPAPVAAPSEEQLQRIEGVEDSIRKAREQRTAKVSDKTKLIEEAMEKSEVAEIRAAIGLDIPFSVRDLLTKGVVAQRGLKVADNMFVDMHTLTKTEDILAERLVEEIYGPMQLSRAYVEAKLVATLAMAITRINRDRFPTPDLNLASRSTPEWAADWALKKGLAEMLSAMAPGDIDGLGYIYANLEKMDVLIEETARKKSG